MVHGLTRSNQRPSGIHIYDCGGGGRMVWLVRWKWTQKKIDDNREFAPKKFGNIKRIIFTNKKSPKINLRAEESRVSSPIRTLTVGSGVSPDLPLTCRRLAGCTAGREFHPALRISAVFQRQTLTTIDQHAHSMKARQCCQTP